MPNTVLGTRARHQDFFSQTTYVLVVRDRQHKVNDKPVLSDRKNQELYGFTHMWDVKLKAANEQARPDTKGHRHRRPCGGYQREGGGAVVKGRGGQVYGKEGDVTLGGGHTMQYTDQVS